MEIPVLIIGAAHDSAIIPAMIKGQEEYITQLTVRQIDASHWALTDKPELSIAHLDEWIDGVILGGKSRL